MSEVGEVGMAGLLLGLIHHFTYSIQFLNEENDREDDGLTLGLQLCYRIVWP